MGRIVLVGWFLFTLAFAHAQENFLEKKDLRSEWLVYRDQGYWPFVQFLEDQSSSVFIKINPKIYRGDRLQITSTAMFSVFCNGFLVQDQKMRVTLSIDSLSVNFPEEILLINIYQQNSLHRESLKTIIGTVLTSASLGEAGPQPRRENVVQNFAVTSVLVTLVFFTVMLKINPRNTVHCFSVIKLFSFREGEDGLSLNRIGNWNNILFYVFTALITGAVILLFQDGQTMDTSQDKKFADMLFQWGLNSSIALAVFFVKALALKMFSVIYSFGEQMGFQFLNFMRMVSISMIILFLVMMVYTALVPDGHVFIFYKAFPWIIITWLAMLFIKLMNRVQVPVFHLFSYICITELIPILFVVKVLSE